MKNSNENATHKPNYFEVAQGVWGLKTVFVNIYMIGINKNDWVLVDTGLKGSANKIKDMAADIFGKNPPKAIILTHGHFDHVGALEALLNVWDVPVFAHSLEMPYLTGMSSYPPPDPSVGGGLMSLLSVFYPKEPINIGERIHALEKDSNIPFLSDWNYINTPGHTPGHISLYRKKDKLIIAGDAFVTTKQESAFSVAKQQKIISGPPKYFTPNWTAAKTSVIKLNNLNPAIAATGHGKPMYGKELTKGLNKLVENFDTVAIPAYGRYVDKPAKTNKKGVLYVPPSRVSPTLLASIITIAGVITFAFVRKLNKSF
jgi:glyoxylase-like metal-dependent hydrolase (beta-lactamase superfamily II)